MSRTHVRFAILLALIAVPLASLHAEEPAPPTKTGTNSTTINPAALIKTGSGTLILTPAPNTAGSTTYAGMIVDRGVNTYTGGTTVEAGTLQLGAVSGTVTLSTGGAYVGNFATDVNNLNVTSAQSGPAMPIPAGPVFFIITEGAGLGDNVRTVPCTGKETVLHAIGAVGGISAASGMKIWIARPSAKNADKGAILAVDWDAIAKRGVNTTNYTLMSGDRLIIGADPLVTRSNLMAKKSAAIERMSGLVNLATCTIAGLKNSPAAGGLVKELVQKGLITDDEQLKKIMIDAIPREEVSKPAAKKPSEHRKHGQEEEKARPAGGATKATAAEKQAERKKKAAILFSGGELKINDGSIAFTVEISDKQPAIAPQDAPHELAMKSLPPNNNGVYYIITQGAGLGDNVRRLPITGKETVLDAISQVGGLSQISSKDIWIARPSASAGKETVLRVDWDAITSRAATATNYQIFPGDRVYIGEDPVITRSNLMAKKTAPIERMMGLISLTTSTVSGLQGTPAAREAVKDLLRKGLSGEDAELKKLLLDAMPEPPR